MNHPTERSGEATGAADAEWLRKVNSHLLRALKQTTSALSSARLIMSDPVTRHYAGNVVDTAREIIEIAERET